MKKLLFIAVAVFGFTFASNAQDVAHFSMDSLYQNLPSYAQAQTLLEQKAKDEEDKLVLKRKEIKTLEEEYVKTESTLPPAIKQLKQQEIQKGYQDLQEMQYAAQQNFEVYQGALNKPIIERVQLAAKNVAKKMGIKYVLEASATVYAGGKNITKEILAEALKLEKEAKTDGK